MTNCESGVLPNPEIIAQLRKNNGEKLLRAYEVHESIVDAMPTHLWIEPTNICNARCPLCPTGSLESTRKKAILNFDLFKQIIDEVYHYVLSINLWNIGEPFLNPYIWKMIRYAADHLMLIRVSTNGFVFYNSKNIELLLTSGLTDLVVSIDGTTASVFNQYRIGIDFEKVLTGVRFLQETKQKRGLELPRVVWQFLAMKHNVHQIAEAKELAKQLGMIFSLKSVNLDMIKTNFQNINFLPDNPALSRYDLQHQSSKWFLKSIKTNDCPILWQSLMINSDGAIVPCCYDYEENLVLGQFPAQSISEVWNGKKMQQLRQQILLERQKIPPCSKCSINAQNTIFLNKKCS